MSSEVMKKDEWRHTVTIASDHPKYPDVDGLFDIHYNQLHLVGIEQTNGCSVTLLFDPGGIFVRLDRMLKLIKKTLKRDNSSCLLWPVIKIGLFSFCVRNSECNLAGSFEFSKGVNCFIWLLSLQTESN